MEEEAAAVVQQRDDCHYDGYDGCHCDDCNDCDGYVHCYHYCDDSND